MKLSILLFLPILLLSQLLGMNKILIKVKEVKNYVKKGNILLKTQILNRITTNKTIQACLGISRLRTPFLLCAIPFSRILDHHGSLKWLCYPESTCTYFMAFQIMMFPLLQPLKRPSLDISLSLRIINITSKKLSIAALVDNDPKLHQRVVLKEETLTKIKHPTSIQNQTNFNILGLYPTSFIVSLYHRHFSMQLIQKGLNTLLSILQHALNSQTQSGLTFSPGELSTLMLSSAVITQCPTTMSKWRRLEILKYTLEQSTQQRQFQQLGNGASHETGLHERHQLLSHTELESWLNMLSISLDSSLPLMPTSMIVLSFSTKLYGVALVLVRTWSSQISTNSQTSDQLTWTQLVLLSFNGHLSPPISNPIQPLRRRYKNHATVGTRGYARLRLLSVTDFTFVTNAQNLDTRAPIVHLDFPWLSLPHSFITSPIKNLFQPPRVQLGVIVK
ncbi:uncharacterized protein LACBIDRAFT_322716 [Laccaria bicolor S238N-H82]|uniref:Predicted protein n=1 Tax=Laccaria bicolor (strain S238N-H82 / ATCC MYA-4686) TaxID=486041 RepID=B0CX98_LACBS|nr:uncharacterized protein LACBIDRAFT_322716 [Laccaria bicolor S238N-H82]EDR13216.1 predicted protein [Laccaria bicolor S238N-H82]|eukprot:XP_001875714.1 predicted protein [Laccaria bicolor S238N-H82]